MRYLTYPAVTPDMQPSANTPRSIFELMNRKSRSGLSTNAEAAFIPLSPNRRLPKIDGRSGFVS
ncbi:hypothetical protein [Bradyrhizobium sp. RD5-C2]|uniref:hypothetical protein n=1 Tax=Bradyrhizobium sp. RD5-C2 TaxID=244562 RepID=UPI001CC79998|nr:hypothetical protein [Bradyrhizobium sp. RD5-C2]